MPDQESVSPDPADLAPGSEVEVPELHVASGRDVADERRRDARFQSLLARGDSRDQAAERRDRAAEGRSAARVDPHAWLDRDWAGRDRDAAAIDRADLLALLDERGAEIEPGTDVPG